MESNFRKALKEVMGIDKAGKTENVVENNEVAADNTVNTAVSEKPEFREPAVSQMRDITLESVKEAEQKKSSGLGNAFSSQNNFGQGANAAETSVITKTTKIEGSIATDSNIVIAGEMIGNVSSTNSISTTGKILGNITCKNFEGSNAKIEGDIKVENTLIIKNNCDIIGDISAKRIELSGRVKGNIVLSGEVFIAKEAYIIGNVTASTISIEKGAIIQGLIKIKTE